MENIFSTKPPATEPSVGNPNTDISPLARLAGLPYQTLLRPSLARAYGVSPQTPLEQRLDLYDLVWATRAVICGAMPAHRVQVDQSSVKYFFDFASFRQNPRDPDTCSVIAELNDGPAPGHLHLSLPGEPQTTVLLVEDDPALAELMRQMLEQNGFQVLIANTGKRGVLTAEHHLPDLILLDVELPDINGFEVFRLLKSTPATRRIPVVICSGRADAAQRAAELGAEGCLRKPEDFAQLISTLRGLLGHL